MIIFYTRIFNLGRI